MSKTRDVKFETKKFANNSISTYPRQGVAECLHCRVEGSLEAGLTALLVRVVMEADMVLSQLLLGW